MKERFSDIYIDLSLSPENTQQRADNVLDKDLFVALFGIDRYLLPVPLTLPPSLFSLSSLTPLLHRLSSLVSSS